MKEWTSIACNGSNGRGDSDTGLYWLTESLTNVRYSQIMEVREGYEKAKRMDIEKIERKYMIKKMLVV